MSAESTISVSAPILTLINVFTVEPARQQELVQLLVAATEEVVQHQPGEHMDAMTRFAHTEPRLYGVASVHHR